MDEQRVKEAVLGVLARSLDAHALTNALRDVSEPAPVPKTTPPPSPSTAERHAAEHVLRWIVLDDILDDAILSAKPSDRSFPLRLFFAELGQRIASGDPEGAPGSEQAFTVASGLNFYFRAAMDDEPKCRLGIEISRQIYALAEVGFELDLLGKSAPLLAALMTSQLDRTKFESVDHMRVFDSQLHERAAGSDPSGARIRRPATFLCRIATNQAVKAKAQVLT